MGNQESVVDEEYVIKKKEKKTKPQQKVKTTQPNQQQYYQHNQQQQYYQQQQNQQQQYYQNQQHNQQQQYYQQNNQQQYQRPINNQNAFQYDTREKIVGKQNSNNALMQRSMLSVYNSGNRVIDYPSNSNNELTVPKANFDNLEFTPYNFTDEVDKFKKNINEEKVQFDKEEERRRRAFENEQKKKEAYLKKQIDYFESKYNPWEILGLEYNDYNIANIKKAYKRNALKYHPDKAGAKYEDKFQLITQAYIYLLGKAEEHVELDTKMSRKVEKLDYEDDINQGVENIYVSKDKFDINQFNKIFEQYKIPNTFDKGYADLMKEDFKNNDNMIEDNQVFGKKFNNDIFNAHFNNIKTKKKSTEMIEFKEPEALDSSFSNLNQSFFGMDDINDFGSVNSSNLSYTDYKKAHVDETLLIDVNKVKYKTYNSIDQLENDRSKLQYSMSPADRERYEYMERKKMEDDNRRMQKQRDHDNMIKNHYNKINQRLIVHK
jgi:hypothetical protein